MISRIRDTSRQQWLKNPRIQKQKNVINDFAGADITTVCNTETVPVIVIIYPSLNIAPGNMVQWWKMWPTGWMNEWIQNEYDFFT